MSIPDVLTGDVSIAPKVLDRHAISQAALECLRNLVFIIAIGNADAHHKNWSLLYPDGTHAALSPAYDLVSTLQYIPNDVLPVVKSMVSATLDAWTSVHPGLPLSPESKQRLEAHWKRVPLLQGTT